MTVQSADELAGLQRVGQLVARTLDVMEAIVELELECSVRRPAAFRLVLAAGRSGPLGLLGAPFVDDARFQSGCRIAVSMVMGV